MVRIEAPDSSDVAVVGAGPCGALAALRLAEAGARVVCLEQGDWPDWADFDPARPDRGAILAGRWSADPAKRHSAHDYPLDDSGAAMRPMMVAAVGGGTTLWTGNVPRLRPSDLRVLSEDGVGADWPLTYADLAPVYDRLEAELGIMRRVGDPRLPPGGPGVVEPPPLRGLAATIASCFERRGWHWWHTDRVVGRAPLPACDVAVDCGPGCPLFRRASFDLAWWPRALAAGAQLVVRARAERIETDAGRASAVVWRDAGGATRRLRTGAVVLAANGIGTPRLLLASGLANRSGQVGRNLMMHPYARVYGLFDAPKTRRCGVEAGAQVSYEFLPSDPSRGFVRGVKLQLITPGHDVAGPVGGAFANPSRHVAGFTVCGEDLPEPGNRVNLDADGMTRVTYRLATNARRMLDFGLDRAEEILRDAGASDMLRVTLVPDSGFHILGTARMGIDPAHSVADPTGHCHDVANLWIADASLFPTASALQPTLTALALAERAAEALLCY